MAADRRLARQYQTMREIREHGSVSAAELADRFDVTVRTIYRDMEDLLQHRVPIQGTPGPEGGYRLRADAELDESVFDSEDAFRMYLAQVEKAQEHLETAPAAEALSSSLEGLLLSGGKMYFDPSDFYWRDEGSGTVLRKIQEALIRSEAVQVRWRGGGEAGRSANTEEVVVPLGLVWKAGHWYLVARDLNADLFRERLVNLTEVEPTGLSFIQPSDFDLEAWWDEEMEAFGKGDTRIIFVADPSAANELRRLTRKKESLFEDLADGGLRVTLFVDSWHWLVPLLASYGPAVTVSEPPQLRAELLEFFRESVAAYDASTGEASEARRSADRSIDDSRLRSTRGRPLRE